MPELFKIPDAQAVLGGVSRPTIYRLIDRGHLTKVNLGSRAFITRASLYGYLHQLGATQTDPETWER